MYRGVSATKPIEAAKEAVRVEDLAERLTGAGVRRGREAAFRCPLHDDHDPSLRVDPRRGVWYCDPCAVGGDVVELARRAWEYPDDGRGAAEAAAFLLMEFGHEVPDRPPSWFRRLERQKPIRDAIDEALLHRQQRRVFTILWRNIGPGVPDAERKAEIEAVWDEAHDIARLLVAGRSS